MIQTILQPFPGSPAPSFNMIGTITRQAEALRLQFRLQGDCSVLKIPTPSGAPQRKHDLWGTTCFEFFLGVPGEERYWEFNCSPSGDWNCYAFDHYRQGMREELAVLALSGKWISQPELLSLDLGFALSQLGLATQPLEISLTAVLETPKEGISYWAIAHCGDQADFHLRESFQLAQ